MIRDDHESLEPLGKRSSKKLYSKKKNGNFLNVEANHKESLLMEDLEGGADSDSMQKDNRVILINQSSLASQESNAKTFKSNAISTAKYNFITFLPLNLYTQFKKLQNLYFLVISYMQTIKSISITNGFATNAIPLTAVVLVSMVKDAFEDYKRHVSDREENEHLASVYDPDRKEFVNIEWKKIKPGQIVKVDDEGSIPADLILLKSSDPKGGLFIETKNLDGETNLKNKNVAKKINSMFANSEWNQLDGSKIVCEKPNNAIYKFEGYLEQSDSNKISLGAENMILRGCRLRNTEFVYGLTVFTGHDSKIMMNSTAAKYKFSSLEKMSNRGIVYVLCTQFTLSLIGGLLGTNWIFDQAVKNDDGIVPAWYLQYGYVSKFIREQANYKPAGIPGPGLQFVQLTCTWIIIFTNLLPISMMVSLEMIKLFQTLFMGWDKQMIEPCVKKSDGTILEVDIPMRAQSSNLNEELGEVEYIFSDKTGTLTCNIMEFKKFSAGYVSYGTGSKPPSNEIQEPNVSFFDGAVKRNLQEGNENRDDLVKAIMALATCHSVIWDEKKQEYTSASPDELALVNAAKQFGYVFKGMNTDDVLIVQTPEGEKKYYHQLNICEFTSTRKRQSNIFQELDGPNPLTARGRGKKILISKGADSVIRELLALGQDKIINQTNTFVTQFAEEGLRTLYLAEKEIDDDTYNQWNEESKQAKLALSEREEKVAAVDAKIETDLKLLGSTAIEDRLQDNVPNTIQFAKNAGIKVWVLTGDKIETAINIGVSAGLLDTVGSDWHQVEETQKDKLMKELSAAYSKLKQNSVLDKEHRKKQALIIAGSSLITIDLNDELKKEFLDISEKVDVVLACRVSPKQKADIVRLIRENHPNKTTLAIGDGANDVAMILAAHVGVGILGKEGQQAARSADYAIGQFQFLKPLLFFHGREAYRRNSYFILYNFYKNFVYVVTQFYFGYWAVFSGEQLFEKFMYQMYNITMTSFPIMWFATFDFEYEKDEDTYREKQESSGDKISATNNTNIQASEVSRDMKFFLKNPELYSIGINKECFSYPLLAKHILYALWHAFVIYMACLFAISSLGAHQTTGKDIDFWLGGMTIFGVAIFVSNMILAQHSTTFEWRYIVLLIFGPICYFFLYWIASKILPGEISHLFINNFSITVIWYAIIFSLVSIYALDMVRQIYEGFDKIEDNMPGAQIEDEDLNDYKNERNSVNHTVQD